MEKGGIGVVLEVILISGEVDEEGAFSRFREGGQQGSIIVLFQLLFLSYWYKNNSHFYHHTNIPTAQFSIPP